MDVLASRVLLRPTEVERAQRFYRDVLGLAVYREFGDATHHGIVFFLAGGFLEVSGTSQQDPAGPVSLWLQVRDVSAEHHRLEALGVDILRPPQRESWGLIEMWIADPDGVRIVLVEVPDDHPLRRDTRTANR
jgi:predicted enzyme related to lactoylglutathione lyase